MARLAWLMSSFDWASGLRALGCGRCKMRLICGKTLKSISKTKLWRFSKNESKAFTQNRKGHRPAKRNQIFA
jgi:hypothetical protein